MSLFIPAAVVVLAAFPYAAGPVADLLPFRPAGPMEFLDRVPLFILLFSVVGLTRLYEVRWANAGNSSLSEINYAVVMLLSITMIPLAELFESARSVLAL